MLRRLYQRLFLALSLLISAQSSPAAAQSGDYGDWRLPLPAGEWTISRGPCGAETPYDHPCGYYEDDCALDLVPRDGGDITGTPVLAAHAGVIAYVGRRSDAGIGVMVEHADGRVSAVFHLSRAGVMVGQAVQRGDLLGEAGGTGTSRPHLHFHVQKNIVERECLWPGGIDGQDFRGALVVSRNLSAAQLNLRLAQRQLDARPPLVVSRQLESVPLPISIPPEAVVQVPVVLTGALSQTTILRSSAVWGPNHRSVASTVLTRTADGPLFRIPVQANTLRRWALHSDPALANEVFHFTFEVGALRSTEIPVGIVLQNPEFVSPTSYSAWGSAPQLCWRLGGAVKQPVRFRVRVVGPQPADSGWQAATCWQPPQLRKGTYFWKVFVRDGDGFVNRTHQRPQAFVIR
jgi:murein DD-endopeptidase MepM/ murein hydrolase activator NlpD